MENLRLMENEIAILAVHWDTSPAGFEDLTARLKSLAERFRLQFC